MLWIETCWTLIEEVKQIVTLTATSSSDHRRLFVDHNKNNQDNEHNNKENNEQNKPFDSKRNLFRICGEGRRAVCDRSESDRLGSHTGVFSVHSKRVVYVAHIQDCHVSLYSFRTVVQHVHYRPSAVIVPDFNDSTRFSFIKMI